MGFVHLILLLLLEKTQEKSVAEVGKSRKEFLGRLLPRKKAFETWRHTIFLLINKGEQPKEASTTAGYRTLKTCTRSTLKEKARDVSNIVSARPSDFLFNIRSPNYQINVPVCFPIFLERKP